jgi:hypothetical protein
MYFRYFGFKSNIPENVNIEDCNDENIDEKLNLAFDGKKVRIDFYQKEDNQNRIMNIEIEL